MILLYPSDRFEEAQIFTFGEQFRASIELVMVGAEFAPLRSEWSFIDLRSSRKESHQRQEMRPVVSRILLMVYEQTRFEGEE